MQKFILVVFSSLLISTCDIIEPEADVRITDWDQHYDEYQEIWSEVSITYRVTNNGDMAIKKYKVYFKITCADGSIFTETDEGYDIPKDYTITDYLYTSTDGKEATSVNIDDYTLLE